MGGGKSIAITPHTARRQSRERLAGNQVACVDVVVVGPQTKSITIARLKTMQLSSHYTNAESAATNDNPEYTSNQRIVLTYGAQMHIYTVNMVYPILHIGYTVSIIYCSIEKVMIFGCNYLYYE